MPQPDLIAVDLAICLRPKEVGFREGLVARRPGECKLVYVLAHASRVAAEASWKAFRDDPEWIKVKSASEVAAGGPLTTRVESVFLAPTDYSPLK